MNDTLSLTPIWKTEQSIGVCHTTALYMRHKLLEKVLVAMGVDEETAAEEACRIEHVIDDNTYDKINEFYEKHMATAAE